jgi:hypothetical protein
MHNGNVGYKGFVICMVLFCAYMQWSPVVDLDYGTHIIACGIRAGYADNCEQRDRFSIKLGV